MNKDEKKQQTCKMELLRINETIGKPQKRSFFSGQSTKRVGAAKGLST